MIIISDNKQLIILMLFLSGCSVLEEASFPRYVLSVTGEAIFGKDEFVYNQDFIDQFPYSAINAQLSDGQNALMVLAYVRDDVYEYVSNDGIKFYFEKGLLTSTEGLSNDISRNLDPDYLSKILGDDSLIDHFHPSGTIDFQDPRAFGLAVQAKIHRKESEFLLNGKIVKGAVITETLRFPQIKRKAKNIYWVVEKRIVKSEYSYPFNAKINIFEVKR